jgi:hypothetical protein
MPVIPALGRQEDCEFKASLGHIVRSVSKKRKKPQKRKATRDSYSRELRVLTSALIPILQSSGTAYSLIRDGETEACRGEVIFSDAGAGQ